MKLIELDKLLAETPPDQLAYFQNDDDEELITETICAFANGKGGKIVIGATPKQGVEGRKEWNVSIISFARFLEHKAYEWAASLIPPVKIFVQNIRFSNGLLFLNKGLISVISIPESDERIQFRTRKGVAWRRMAGKNVEIASSISVSSAVDMFDDDVFDLV